VPAGEDYIAIGWGYTESGEGAQSLMEAKLTNNTLDACKDKFASNIAVAPHVWGITPRMICAGGGATATCEGDSGGPLIYGSQVVGLVSFGDICLSGTESPSLFTKLRCFQSFVKPASTASPTSCEQEKTERR
jgi:trypsin